MRRSIEQAFLDLRQHIASLAQTGARHEAKPGISIFVYPPEWEAVMLARYPDFAENCSSAGWPINVVNVGQGFLAEIERKRGFEEQLSALEREGRTRLLLNDLGVVAEKYLTRVIKSPLVSPQIARLLVNTGALASIASYSAITNKLHDDGTGSEVLAPTIIAFPGDGDERSLNLLRLRGDTNYRVPRI